MALQTRKLVHHAEDNGLLNNNLCGAHPSQVAQPTILSDWKNLSEKSHKIKPKTFNKNAEDATGHYDKKNPEIGNLASQSFGMHCGL
jgi:hypothetical protein